MSIELLSSKNDSQIAEEYWLNELNLFQSNTLGFLLKPKIVRRSVLEDLRILDVGFVTKPHSNLTSFVESETLLISLILIFLYRLNQYSQISVWVEEIFFFPENARSKEAFCYLPLNIDLKANSTFNEVVKKLRKIKNLIYQPHQIPVQEVREKYNLVLADSLKIKITLSEKENFRVSSHDGEIVFNIDKNKP
ncbi:MAG: hypothetical protein AB7F64_09220, partial [Gammaproteobacteria bacterium]